MTYIIGRDECALGTTLYINSIIPFVMGSDRNKALQFSSEEDAQKFAKANNLHLLANGESFATDEGYSIFNL